MLLFLPGLLLLQVVDCGHFLFWMPLSSRSVKIGALEAGYGLAKKGHTITVVSPFRSKKETAGVTEIVHLSEFEALQDLLSTRQLVERAEVPFPQLIQTSINNNRHALQNSEVRQLLNDEVKIDVVVVVPAFGNEAGYYLAHRKKASLVTILPVAVSFPYINYAIGDPFNPAYVPLVVTGYSSQMSFKERCINTVLTVAVKLVVDLYARPQVDSMLKEQFPDQVVPSIHKMSLTTALHINHGSPFTGDGLRPVMPKTIMAGLMTCRPGQPLPKDLDDFVEGAEHGVIFVSFGSVLKASKMPEEKRLLLLAVFSTLKQRVIWKWEAAMPDAPDNVLVSAWLPQQDLLAHEKVVLFITHGGAGSLQETVCHKTPIVGIPITLDQHMNVAEAVQRGLGVLQDWHELQARQLEAAIQDVITTPIYLEAVSQLSDLILDQPDHPLDRAVWWLEYLLRHPGNPGMRSPTLLLSWSQYFLLDVLAFFFTVILIIGWLFKRLFLYCCAWKRKTD